MPKDQYYINTRRLVSQDDASIIQRAEVPRSKFEGSWTRKTAFDAGYLVPIMVEEVLPGDHLRYNVTAYVRMATPLFPMFDNQRIDTFFFFCPNRLLWDNWTKFMGEQTDPDVELEAHEAPWGRPVPSGLYTVGSIFDHMGLPVTNTDGDPFGSPANIYHHSILPFRAYNLIWNDWFRDQNLQQSLIVYKVDGEEPGPTTSVYTLQRRAKFHDYFTSALPNPQKFTGPTVPVAGLAPITGIGWDPTGTTTDTGGGPPGLDVTETGGATVNYLKWHEDGAGKMVVKSEAALGVPMIYANLAEATGVAINTFRQAFLVQQLLEKEARGGTRYGEQIQNMFGVRNPDSRLQRPEYIGGGSSPLQITPVAQTTPTAELPVGALGAAGTSVGQHSASFAATEHGWIIGLINVRTELSYQQGLHRKWTRLTRYDHYVPTLAGLGEQAILMKEIFCTGGINWPPVDADPDEQVFGYQERWHEYRQNYSEITGIMRSTAAGTLDNWHLAQYFDPLAPPTLSADFIADTPPMARVLAAGDLAEGQQYLADIMFQRTAVRAIPTFGTPVTLGRF